MIKKVSLSFLGVLVIIASISIILVFYGRSVLGTNHAFSYVVNQYYSTEINTEEILSAEQIVDQADYIVEVEVVNQRIQYEKNILVEATVLDSNRGMMEIGQTIYIVEPSFGTGYFYNGYIPLGSGNRYTLFLKDCHDFAFLAYQFVYAGPAFLTSGKPNYAKWNNEWQVIDLMGKYDYFDNFEDFYQELKAYYDKLI